MAQWIWYFGDFEKYHNNLLHLRREQYGCIEPPIWPLYQPEPIVRFTSSFETKGGMMHIFTLGEASVDLEDEHGNSWKCYDEREIMLKEGIYKITVRIANPGEFPALFIDGICETDENWVADDMSGEFTRVGTMDCFNSKDKSPLVFPFSYEDISYVSKEECADGILFDFGKETFAKTTFITKCPYLNVSFGESKEEALSKDPYGPVVQIKNKRIENELQWPSTAFRYIFVKEKDVEIKAQYEYLDLPYKGSFKCDNELINRIYDTAKYTFHLNSREFFLDGIKRDRWVWCADAYQSFFVNHYLFHDKEIEKRTLISLAGGIPFKKHINTIVDYTFFWFIALKEYMDEFHDTCFLFSIEKNMHEIMNYILKHVDCDGFFRGVKSDWIFIDWADMDKTGALLGEQVLFYKALMCYSELCKSLHKDDQGTKDMAISLEKKIKEMFYDPKKRVFIDSYESGKQNVTRQNNILAYLFLPLSEEEKHAIYQNVILNDDVMQITTPYFKFYENQVHALEGNEKNLDDSLISYYGAMLDTGATTLYEEFDPNITDEKMFAMYGRPFEKSLCHAWSASPIYLLGAFRLGVKRKEQTGKETHFPFEVRPSLGTFKEIDGCVPIYDGFVYVKMNKERLEVTATIEGGILYYNNQEIVLHPDEKVII